jgi:hypothetical protein
VPDQVTPENPGTPGFYESRYTDTRYSDYVRKLGGYFEHSLGSTVDRLENFAKYVPRSSMARFLAKYEIFKQVLSVHGSIVECGVLHGGGLMTWAQLSAILEPANHQRRIVGFDTFAGFPSIAAEDRKSKSDFLREGALAVDSYEDLLECVQLYDMTRYMGHIEKVSLVRGDINETVPRYLEENPHTVLSLLYLDVDVFEPTVTAIRHFLPRMPKGAVIAFDELNSPAWPGETLAVVQELGLNTLRLKRVEFGTLISYAVIE